jgi:hypothetical protein
MGVRRRTPLPPPVNGYPQEIEGLLDDVRQLRTTMATDLSAAAAAVDSDAGGVARDIIEADRDDLAALGVRATRPIATEHPAARAGRRGALGLVGAAVVLPCVAALAVGGVILSGHGGNRPTRSTPTHSAASPAAVDLLAASKAAEVMLRTLQTDVGRGADSNVVAADLTRLRTQLATVTTASGGRATLSAVRRMVALERRTVIRYRRDGGALPVAVPTPATPQPGRLRSTQAPRSTVRRARSHVHHTPATPPATSSPPLTLPTTPPTLPGSVAG